MLAFTNALSGGQLLAHAGYLISIILFILGIMRLGKVKTARSGNQLAALAMLVAVVAALLEMGNISPAFIIAGLVIGGGIGWYISAKVEMTGMPELVALLNGSGGLASALVAIAAVAALSSLGPLKSASIAGADPSFVAGIAIGLSILIGCVTFTGSVVAYLKLSQKIQGSPIMLPGRHVLNIVLGLGSIAATVAVVFAPISPAVGWALIAAITIMTLILGVTLVIPIGGGDMPVVISLLNSYSGLAAAAAGFAINSQVLIVSGSLVGASGLILTRIMCKAMNRSLANVLFGGFGAESSSGPSEDARDYKNVKESSGEEAAMIMEDIETLIVVPGYGMAVAQAQHAVRDLTDVLEDRGVKVRFAVHPVAGRMPGHMNVLLAEANVPYEQLFEMDAINSDFKNTDAVLIIGANDVVNPDAINKPDSPLAGMPVLNVWEARTTFVIKRSLSPGFAGVKNPLFEAENNYMLFGDARDVVEDIMKSLKDAD